MKNMFNQSKTKKVTLALFLTFSLALSPLATLAAVPFTPVNTAPANNAVDVAPTASLSATAFNDPDGVDTHSASEWEISQTSGDYISPAYSSGVDAVNLTNLALPGLLAEGTQYFWHVRYQDNNSEWSNWSTETNFTLASSAPALSCGDLIESDLTLTEDLNCSAGPALRVKSPSGGSVTIDCASHTINAPVGIEIASDSYPEINIRNCVFEGFQTAIGGNSTDQLVISNNTFNNTLGGFGIKLNDAQGLNINSNTFNFSGSTDSFVGIDVETAGFPQIYGNTITVLGTLNSFKGIALNRVSSGQIQSNSITASGAGDLKGIYLEESNGNGVSDNDIDISSTGTSSADIFLTGDSLNMMNTGDNDCSCLFNEGMLSITNATACTNDPSLVNVAPEKPSNVSPADGSEVSVLAPTLSASAFVDSNTTSDGDSHQASQWQITSVLSDYSSPVFDSGVDTTNLTSIALTSDLANEITYYWHVRYQDSLNDTWSDWSNQTAFTTKYVDNGNGGGGGRRRDITAPAEVANVVLTLINTAEKQGVEITWENPTDSDLAGVKIYRSQSSFSEGGESSFTEIAQVDDEFETYFDSNVTDGQTYYYILRPYDTNANENQNNNEYSISIDFSSDDEDDNQDDGNVDDDEEDSSDDEEQSGEQEDEDSNEDQEESEPETEESVVVEQQPVIESQPEVAGEKISAEEVEENEPASQEELGFWDRVNQRLDNFWDNLSGDLGQTVQGMFGGLSLLSILILILAIIILICVLKMTSKREDK